MAARAAGDSLINFKFLIKLFGSAIILYELGTLVSLLLMIYIPVESLIIYSLGVAVANVEATAGAALGAQRKFPWCTLEKIRFFSTEFQFQLIYCFE